MPKRDVSRLTPPTLLPYFVTGRFGEYHIHSREKKEPLAIADKEQHADEIVRALNAVALNMIHEPA